MTSIKWIIGYIDYQGAVHSHVVRLGDTVDSHTLVWPGRVAAHGKWRWKPDRPYHISTYNGEEFTDDEAYAIFDKIDKLTR